MTATFIILCIGANLLFFLLRRWEAKGKSRPNYIPDYALKAELMEQVSSVIAKYGEKAASQLPSALALPRAIRCFFNEYENLCLDSDGVVLSRTFLATTYRGNDGFVQIGTLSYGEDAILVRKDQSDENIYIVGCEDDDPAKPEVYATSFENFIAMCIGEYLEGVFNLWIEMRPSSDAMWTIQYPQYKDNSDTDQETNALKHELDHFNTWKSFYDFVKTADQYDGKKFADCQRRIAIMMQRYSEYHELASKHSLSFHNNGMASGGRYSQHPFDTSAFKWE